MAPRVRHTALRTALLATGLAVASSLAAQAAPSYQVAGTLRVDGGSTVRSWSCEAGTLNAQVTGAAGATLALSEVARAVQAVQLVVPTAGLDCDNDTMNDHMWNALNKDRHPEIRFRMESYTASPASSGTVQLQMRGTLELHGQTHPITLAASATEATTACTAPQASAIRAALAANSAPLEVSAELRTAMPPFQLSGNTPTGEMA